MKKRSKEQIPKIKQRRQKASNNCTMRNRQKSKIAIAILDYITILDHHIHFAFLRHQ